jgi:hypothetical protein
MVIQFDQFEIEPPFFTRLKFPLRFGETEIMVRVMPGD